jgi:hypothetical protein
VTGKNNSGSSLWQAPRDIQPKGPAAASDDSMIKLRENQGCRWKRADGATAAGRHSRADACVAGGDG